MSRAKKPKALTPNDRRVLDAIDVACGEYDGFMPHGARDWVAIRRLERAGMVESTDFATCCTCAEGHEGWAYTLTKKGEQVKP